MVMHASLRKALAIGGMENKVKLSSTSSIASERSSHSNNQRAPKIKQNSIWKHLRTTICQTRFQKQVSRNVMLNCFHTQENILISIKIVSKQVYMRDISAVWIPSNLQWRKTNLYSDPGNGFLQNIFRHGNRMQKYHLSDSNAPSNDSTNPIVLMP